jgi:hypothetical protein
MHHYEFKSQKMSSVFVGISRKKNKLRRENRRDINSVEYIQLIQSQKMLKIHIFIYIH